MYAAMRLQKHFNPCMAHADGKPEKQHTNMPPIADKIAIEGMLYLDEKFVEIVSRGLFCIEKEIVLAGKEIAR